MTRTEYALTALAAALALVAAAVWVVVGSQAAPTPSAWDRLPYCLSDDGTMPAGATVCRWDAHVQGDGRGASFIFDGTNATLIP